MGKKSNEKSRITVDVTTFLSNKSFWQTLLAKVRAARHVDAAVAYFGQRGSKLLPLRRGDCFVVDMSLATVRSGATDPREVATLIRRGVQVFSRGNLHAKIVVLENLAFVGSANVSRNSMRLLDEAAVMTTERSVVRRAREFVDRLCTEPVRLEYLKRCIQLYKSSKFNREQNRRGSASRRTTHAKLWIVNLQESELPKREAKRYEKGVVHSRKLIKDGFHSTTDSFHWPKKPRMATELEPGDWLISVVKFKNKTVSAFPPGQFRFLDNYTRDRKSGKKRYVFHLEISAPRRNDHMVTLPAGGTVISQPR